jgi:integrase
MSSTTARVRNKLTDKAVRAHKAGELADGGGLYVVATKAGRKRFIHRFQWNGKTAERWFAGSYPDEISLSEARDLRDADRKLLKQGVNPILAAKADDASPLFGEYAKRHIDHLAPPSPEHRAHWLKDVTERVGTLADRPVDQIRFEEVKAIIAPLWTTKPSTARTLCLRIRRVIAHRNANAYPGELRANPADLDLMAAALSRKLNRKHKPRKAIAYDALPEFMAKLAERKPISARVLEFTILAGARVNEATPARWNEIDWRGRTWTIPAPRTKTRHEPHVVPLSLGMVRVLRKLWTPGQSPDGLIFPNSRGKPFDDKSVLEHVQAITGGKETVHGMRSSFMDWGTSIEHRKREPFSRDLMNAALSHALGDAVSQAYLRDRWIGRRRLVMREWSRFLYPPAASNVVPFRRAA